ncbi:MAG: RdgB/HAM1 family non-canonical purine NTP pyrophosphatase [Candidatus Omnitrophica bacterium]|nr:dITP/XTP pyrophosphatase [bacterium]NUN98223.1 RdgB/HAM1 family non-canonical purine NTP pyrophosphatase [Candidatus Omnitrophota bacterium]
MRPILLASRNRKKALELGQLLEGLPFEVVSLEEFPEYPEVVEDGLTFEANSEKKAREASLFTGLWSLADDSGLVVDALGGEPGVYSARYGGKESDGERNRFLLEKLSAVPPDKRTARFVCCATLFGDGKILFQASGECEGRILDAPRGSQGFGYDPIFQPPGMDRSMAELPPGEKHAISHRGKALAAVREFLKQLGK